MKLPPMLLAAAVMFWGWQSGQWWLATGAAILLETPRLLERRLRVSMQDLTRVSNLCALLFLALLAWLFFTGDITQAIVETIKWSPFLVLPLFLAIAYGGLLAVDPGVVFLSLRKAPAAGLPNLADKTPTAVNFGCLYLAFWLLAASIPNRQGHGFYLGMLLLCGWALWDIRPRGHSSLVWGGVLLLAALGGALINSGLYALQEALEQVVLDWIGGGGDEDPMRSRTSLGHIGQLKLSDSIVLRVQAPQPGLPLQLPLLLRTASYNAFSGAAWIVAGDGSFHVVREEARSGIWKVEETAGNAGMQIATSATRPTGLLALPQGAVEIGAGQFRNITRNRLGTLQAEMGGGQYTYRVAYDAGAGDRSTPLADDLKLPRNDAAMLQDVVRQLQLEGKPSAQILASLKQYFAANFSYNLYRSGNAANNTAVGDFLLRNRSGHCEHFATATTLLLRAAGIPARYAVGYSLQEPSRFGPGFVARKRDAHAWVQAYVNGAWQDFDTTPATWPTLEAKSAPIWEPLMDALSWLWFLVRGFHFSAYQIWIGVAGMLALAWYGRKLLREAGGLRLALQRRPGHAAMAGKTNEEDSAMQPIEQLLAARGWPRPPYEPLTQWLARIAPSLGGEASAALTPIVLQHYRCRFGPQPVPAAEDAHLRKACREWIVRFGPDIQKDVEP